MTVADVTGSETWLGRDADVLAGVLPRYYDVVAERGEGSWIVDVDGRRFLDFGSGIAVTNVGHCHPKVVAAIQQQAAALIHTSVVVHHQRNVELAERLVALTPFLDDPQVFFCNSGAEAVDGAIKLARRVTGRPGLVAFSGAFHGRTMGATSLTTAKPKYRDGYGPLLPGVHHAPYGAPAPGGAGAALGDLDGLLARAPASEIAAMIVEPVLGEGGYVVPPAAWLAGLRERCDAHGILLIFDEVQCGVGRTGRPFAAETFGVAPDVLLFAKGIASGLPLGGIVAPRRLMSRWPTGTHGSTFGGNPVACAAALATLDVVEEGDLCHRARVLGERAMRSLRDLQRRAPDVVVDVRGVGLMIGIELPDRATAAAVSRRCLESQLIVLTCGPEDNVLRLAPPLTIADDELDLGLDVLERAVRSVRQQLP
jgi:4-aminobutyrate aminotransferase